ncbi:hypothetical protein GCM10010965_09730 [Caldalkalibacillus thermarum]|uniref:hypothetical protein n=1 Tax=Caldalkalibacillus thermarum TaxID=296745 RepID=UPI001663F178|nr:hypothetical protein [Caldalkalibacillus thermarum]GGK18760.1 hypothetical protein GCM10010965_09730 [Caldalkalibacillus thermarum]
MARRIATEYRNILIDLNLTQFEEFMHLLQEADIQTEVRIFENGDKECMLYDKYCLIPLAFRNMGSYLKCTGTFVVYDWNIAYALQRSLQQFKGNAMCYRIYQGEMIEYEYVQGQIIKITEIKNGKRQLIYKSDHMFPYIQQQLYHSTKIEEQIAAIKAEIDSLLDQRIAASHTKVTDETKVADIDEQLKGLVKKLFVLEA